MATHLLDDVQQVCDHVVMIDAGKLVVSGRDRLAARAHGLGHGRRRRPLAERWSPALEPTPGARRPTASTRAWSRSTSTATTSWTCSSRRRSPSCGLPLYRLSTAPTSLDEVFLDGAGRTIGGQP